jgi:hypothetical protein
MLDVSVKWRGVLRFCLVFLTISGKQSCSFSVDRCQQAELFIVRSLPGVL